jgi:hypothetical protein
LATANKDSGTVGVLLNTTLPGALTATFSFAASFVAGAEPSAVAAADVNRDGKLDLVAADTASNDVAVLLNTTAPGASTPTFSTATFVPVGIGPVAASAQDLNGDGAVELVVANRDSGTVSVLFNLTDPGASLPSFSVAQDVITGGSPVVLTAHDLNADGRPDLETADPTTGAASVWLNQTALGSVGASFSGPNPVEVGFGVTALAVSDVDGDGRSDLNMVKRGIVSVLSNRTPLGFSATMFSGPQEFDAAGASGGIVSADLDSDGRQDLVVLSPGTDSVLLLVNSLAQPGPTVGGVVPRQQFNSFDTALETAVADMNRDGKPDLIQTAYGSITVFMNVTPPGQSALAFQSTRMRPPHHTDFTAVSDLNLDGRPDLAVCDSFREQVFTLFNTTAPGAVQASFMEQPTTTLTGAYLAGVTAEDMNGDGRADLIVAVGDATPASDHVSVLMNKTVPGADSVSLGAPVDVTVPNGSEAPAVGDLNNDGRPDIAVAASASNQMAVLVNSTPPGAEAASFQPYQSFSIGDARSPNSIALGDLNRDGRLDVLTANLQSPRPGGSVFINTTAPGAAVVGFAAAQQLDAGGIPKGAALMDFDGDGALDMLIGEDGGEQIRVFRNATAPGSNTLSISSEATIDDVHWATALRVADINLDGKTDLVASGADEGTSVLLNSQYLIGGLPAIATGTIEYHWTIPDPFSLGSVTAAALGTWYESQDVIVSGINYPAPISVLGGDYRINNGPYLSTDGTVSVGDRVRVRARSAASVATASRATLDIGGVTADFQITTGASQPSSGGGGALSKDLVLAMLLLTVFPRRFRRVSPVGRRPIRSCW